MNKDQAEQIADVLNGEACLDENCIDEADGWLVIFERRAGRLVVLTGRAVDEYADRAAFARSYCYATISFRDDSA